MKPIEGLCATTEQVQFFFENHFFWSLLLCIIYGDNVQTNLPGFIFYVRKPSFSFSRIIFNNGLARSLQGALRIIRI